MCVDAKCMDEGWRMEKCVNRDRLFRWNLFGKRDTILFFLFFR